MKISQKNEFFGWKQVYRAMNIAVASEIVGSLVFAIGATLSFSRKLFPEAICGGWIVSLILAVIPTMLGGVILSLLINADLKRSMHSKKRSILTGAIVGFGIGCIIVMLVMSLTQEFYSVLGVGLFAVAIATICGGWSGRKVFNDLMKKIEGEKND